MTQTNRPAYDALMLLNPALKAQITSLQERLLTAPDAELSADVQASWKRQTNRVNAKFDAVVGGRAE